MEKVEPASKKLTAIRALSITDDDQTGNSRNELRPFLSFLGLTRGSFALQKRKVAIEEDPPEHSQIQNGIGETDRNAGGKSTALSSYPQERWPILSESCPSNNSGRVIRPKVFA
jgi:hypothetical protein